MDFLLKSEVLTRDINKGHMKRAIYCPFCMRPQIKKVEETEYYTKYKCWNKYCDNHEPFVVIKDFIEKEKFFNLVCESCGEPYHRDVVERNGTIYLKFECESKLCGAFDDPLLFDITSGNWQNGGPEFKVYDDQIELSSIDSDAILKDLESDHDALQQTDLSKVDVKVKEQQTELVHVTNSAEPKRKLNVKMPLLNMNQEAYAEFLEAHNGKVIILVDVPNFIRTLHDYYPINFQDVLKRAYDLLIDFIDKYYRVSEDYMIRYFSKPDEDLMRPNQFLMDKCRTHSDSEFFHLLKIDKKGHYSDIDNYLITNAVEILERCEILGFSIVSSDKDYLPVMRIADYKAIRSCILGINTSDIYQKYNIGDIKFLNVLSYFDT